MSDFDGYPINTSSNVMATSSNDDENDGQPDPNSFKEPTTSEDNHCSLSNLRALALMMCRMTGLAPLTFEKQGSLWVVRVSRTAYFYSILLISTMNIAAVTSVYMDMTVDPSKAVVLSSPTEAMIWSVYYALVAIAVNISAFMAPAKMKAMIGFVNRIQQINLEIKINNEDKSRDKLYIAVLIVDLILHTWLTLYDCCVFIFLQNDKMRDLTDTFIGCLFVSHYLLYYNQIFIIMMFQLQVLALLTALKTINDHLERLFYVIRNEDFSSSLAGPLMANDHDEIIPQCTGVNDNTQDIVLIQRNEIPLVSSVPLTSVNTVIDRLANNSHITDLQSLLKKSSIHETVRSITLSFLDVCKLMEEVNQCFGVVILVLVLISLVQLVTMGYYVFMSLYTKPQLKMEMVWCLRHLMTLLLLMEPCHWTYQELIRTRGLMKQLSCLTAAVVGPFAAELKRFFFCLCLSNTSFSPLGVCTLTRPICVTILGSVISYLVIVIQFQIGKS